MKLTLIVYAVLFVALAEVLGGELGRRSSVFSDVEKEWQHSFFRRRDEEEKEEKKNDGEVTETEEVTEETTESNTERPAQTPPTHATEETTASTSTTEAPGARKTGVRIGVGALAALALFGLLLCVILVSCVIYVRCLLMLLRHPFRVRGTTGRASRRIY